MDKLASSTINLDKTSKKEKFPQKEGKVMRDLKNISASGRRLMLHLMRIMKKAIRLLK